MKRFSETGKWEDPWFRGLAGIHKLVFLYVIDRCNNAGFWEIDEEALVWHTKLDPKHIEGAWKGLARGLLVAGGWMWVRRFLRHQKNEPLTHENLAHRQIVLLLREQQERFKDVKEFQEWQAPYMGLISPTGTGKVKEESKKGSEEGKPKKDKGTLEEVTTFFASEDLLHSDAEWFFHKCQGSGWTNDGKPIKDWKATVRSWRAGGYLASQRNPSLAASNGNHHPKPEDPLWPEFLKSINRPGEWTMKTAPDYLHSDFKAWRASH